MRGQPAKPLHWSNFWGPMTSSMWDVLRRVPEHTVAIGQTAVGSADLEIINLGDYECPVNGPVSLSAEPDGNTITIPEQIIDCGSISYTFSGSGMIEADTISLSFSVTYESDGLSQQDNCTAKLIK